MKSNGLHGSGEYKGANAMARRRAESGRKMKAWEEKTSRWEEESFEMEEEREGEWI